MPNKRPPFTLVELLCVIAIFTVLASILIPMLRSSRQLGFMRRTQTESDINELRNYNGWTIARLDNETHTVRLGKADFQSVHVRLSPRHFELVSNMHILDVSVLEAMDRLRTENENK